jgi:hypothetical protein
MENLYRDFISYKAFLTLSNFNGRFSRAARRMQAMRVG